MYYHRPAKDRGRADFGWLDSKHSFSFGNYYDPQHMGMSVLRVINDDTVDPGAGFGKHGHKDMEIISYVLEGSIEHKDSMGNSYIVPAGDIQRMSAGTGVKHSEFNHSKTDNLRFLQIWIQPNVKGSLPSYEQKKIVQHEKLTALITPSGSGNSLSIQQDVNMYRLELPANESIRLSTIERPGYLHVIEGSINTETYSLKDGDALGVYQETLTLNAGVQGVVALWFDLPTKST
jgi:redox-sensitive bicupin YhaK (pirin superfamily)